jgi:hypothetical protein
MIDIELAAIPNQTVSIRLDDQLYRITVKETRGTMAVDIVRDDETLVQGARIVAGTPLLPYLYMEVGNFVLLTEDEEYPYYTKFGDSQNLVYVTPAEIATLRNE